MKTGKVAIMETVKKEHELIDFFRNANEDIDREYKRIRKRTLEDPGTAGDQGEENWAHVLKMWLPPYFQVVTKGRILGDNGETSPQIDVLVLSPEYPKQLIDCKLYLAGGVVAAFECKLTLRKSHIKDLMETSKIITDLALKECGTARKDLKRKIFYGLLAHSHVWKDEKSQPKINIRSAIKEYDSEVIKHPIETPDFICVSDLGTWSSIKLIVPPQENIESYKNLTVISSYGEDDETLNFYTPVGAMVFTLLEYLSWDYPGLRNLVTYMKKLDLEGVKNGNKRIWNADVLSETTINCLVFTKILGEWDENNLVVM